MRRLFADLLRHHMDRAGISVLDMSRAVGLSRSFVYGIRDGYRVPKPSRLTAMADALALDGDDRLAFLAAAAWATARPELVALLADAPMAKVGRLLDRAPR